MLGEGKSVMLCLSVRGWAPLAQGGVSFSGAQGGGLGGGAQKGSLLAGPAHACSCFFLTEMRFLRAASIS